MKPTKRTKATKKERGIKSNPVLDKLMKLKYRINDTFKDGRVTDKSDKDWVMEEISNLRNGGWLTATKMKVANKLWYAYRGHNEFTV